MTNYCNGPRGQLENQFKSCDAGRCDINPILHQQLKFTN